MNILKKGFRINDRYVLIECLGNGVFSEVWRAFDETLESEVALKIYAPLTPDGMKELKREYGNTLGVAHQNLLTAQGMDVYTDGAFLVMKCCSRGSAFTLRGMVDETTVWKFIHDVASGLTYLHGLDEPIIHQDMKLANIMIDNDGGFLISDFGISYKVTQIMVRQTGRGREANTSYMSPERFSADYTEPLSSSDVWSLGVMIYELATGKLPFESFGGAGQRRGLPKPVLPHGWSGELQYVINRCLELNTWDRPQAERVKKFASMMLGNQHPDSSVLGDDGEGIPAKRGYGSTSIDEAMDRAARMAMQEQEEVVANIGLYPSPQSQPQPQPQPQPQSQQQPQQPQYPSVSNTWGQSQPPRTEAPVFPGHPLPQQPHASNTPQMGAQPDAPIGYRPVGDASTDESTHFTSGTRYRGGGTRNRRTAHKHRSPLKKAWDYIKGKSSILSFLLVLGLCVGAFSYGIDNLLTLQFLPKKDPNVGAKEEKTEEVAAPEEIEVVDTFAVQGADGLPIARDNSLPVPPPPHDVRYQMRTKISDTDIEKSLASGENKTPANEGVNPVSEQKSEPEPKAAPEPTKQDKKVADNKKGKQPAPNSPELASAIQRGDYDAIKLMADGGSPAAAGIMAKYYLKKNKHAQADAYAKKAKAGGDPAGDEVINMLTVQGYYN